VIANIQTGGIGISRLNIIQDMGFVDGDGLIEDAVMFGTRTFSIVDAETGALAFDSGNMIEAYVLANDAALFNINKRQGTLQARSDDKGPEPSAFAALAGLATLTMATGRRRRAAVQIKATM